MQRVVEIVSRLGRFGRHKREPRTPHDHRRIADAEFKRLRKAARMKQAARSGGIAGS